MTLPPRKSVWGMTWKIGLRISIGGQDEEAGVYSAEQIIGKMREAEVLLSQGSTVGELSRKLGITEQTYYRWRREYGGMRIEQARSLKELEKENGRSRDRWRI